MPKRAGTKESPIRIDVLECRVCKRPITPEEESRSWKGVCRPCRNAYTRTQKRRKMVHELTNRGVNTIASVNLSAVEFLRLYTPYALRFLKGNSPAPGCIVVTPGSVYLRLWGEEFFYILNPEAIALLLARRWVGITDTVMRLEGLDGAPLDLKEFLSGRTPVPVEL